MSTLYYIHDPMCSWCWAYRPIFQQLCQSLANRALEIECLLGGLAPDTQEIMPAPMQKKIRMIWRQIEQQTGTPFNYDFWQQCQPRRSTYPACRAVIAASRQQAQQAMTDAIQEAYYLRAMNPSDEETLLQLADELDLDFEQFAEDLNSQATEQALQQQIALANRMPIKGFPSWVLEWQGRYYPIPLDYQSPLSTLAALGDVMKSA